MFENYYLFLEIDLSGIKTNNLKDMSFMNNNCEGLTKLNFLF